MTAGFFRVLELVGLVDLSAALFAAALVAGLASVATTLGVGLALAGAFGATRGGARRKSGWRIGRFWARVSAGTACAARLVNTASSACLSAGVKSGLGVGSLAGCMVVSWA